MLGKSQKSAHKKKSLKKSNDLGVCSVSLKRLLSNDKLSKILLNERRRNQEM